MGLSTAVEEFKALADRFGSGDRLRPPPVVTGGNASEARTFTTKHGTAAKMNTAAIGKKPANGAQADQAR